MSRFTLDQLPEKYALQAQAQMKGNVPQGPSSPTPPGKTSPRAKEGAKPRIRQNGAGLNKTEQAFHDYLVSKFPDRKVLSQSLTLRLANGCRYTPDEITFCPKTQKTCAYEIKGFARDDAVVKLKVAASIFPWITFFLVTKTKAGWEIQEVLG